MPDNDSDVSNVTTPLQSDEPTDDPPQTSANGEYIDADADDGLAMLEDHTLQRDPSGKLEPRRVSDIDELDGADVIARPLTRQERRQYIEDLATGQKDEISDAELAELFDAKIVKPDLTKHELCDGRVTERFVREGLTGRQQDGFYIAILLASDEGEMVRRMRGELTDDELRAMIASKHGRIPQSGNREGDGFRDGVDSTKSKN